MNLLFAAFLGIVQGVTEFLPVSSSGHLVLARAFFGFDMGRLGLAFDVACHIGTFAAVVAFFWPDIAGMTARMPRALAGHQGPHERLLRLVIVGTLPVVVVGLLFGDYVEGPLRTPGVVASMLALGAFGLILADRVGAGARDEQSLSYWDALAIGLAQAAALVPGVSRSGATLTVAILLGLRRPAAARFVFLMSLPAVAAAVAKEAYELGDVGLQGLPISLIVVGVLVSGVVGYLTVKYLIKYLATHSMTVFAAYRFALSAATFIWLASR